MDTVFKTNRQTNKNHHMQTSSWGKSGKKGTNVSFSKYKKITLKKKKKQNPDLAHLKKSH